MTYYFQQQSISKLQIEFKSFLIRLKLCKFHMVLIKQSRSSSTHGSKIAYLAHENPINNLPTLSNRSVKQQNTQTYTQNQNITTIPKYSEPEISTAITHETWLHQDTHTHSHATGQELTQPATHTTQPCQHTRTLIHN
jgi:hypothetical protein